MVVFKVCRSAAALTGTQASESLALSCQWQPEAGSDAVRVGVGPARPGPASLLLLAVWSPGPGRGGLLGQPAIVTRAAAAAIFGLRIPGRSPGRSPSQLEHFKF